MSITLSISFKGSVDDVVLSVNNPLYILFEKIEQIYNIPITNQKLLHKKIKLTEKDKDILVKDSGLKSKDKIMLIGSTLFEIEKQTKAFVDQPLRVDTVVEEKWEDEEMHAKMINRGQIAGTQTELDKIQKPLPADKTVTNLIDKFGQKLRIRFDYSSIRMSTNTGSFDIPYEELIRIESQKITKYPGYSILKITTTGKSYSKKFYVYFCPTQYLNAIELYSINNIFP